MGRLFPSQNPWKLYHKISLSATKLSRYNIFIRVYDKNL